MTTAVVPLRKEKKDVNYYISCSVAGGAWENLFSYFKQIALVADLAVNPSNEEISYCLLEAKKFR